MTNIIKSEKLPSHLPAPTGSPGELQWDHSTQRWPQHFLNSQLFLVTRLILLIYQSTYDKFKQQPINSVCENHTNGWAGCVYTLRHLTGWGKTVFYWAQVNEQQYSILEQTLAKQIQHWDDRVFIICTKRNYAVTMCSPV